MNKAQTLNLLAQQRQQLQQTRDAMLPEEVGTPAMLAVDEALYHLANALTRIDTPTVTPDAPWIGVTSEERLPNPTYTNGA